MQKIKVKELVEFRRKLTEKSKKHFAQKLKTRIYKIKKTIIPKSLTFFQFLQLKVYCFEK